jgi:ABC-type bacteriocin/lantibiotic exporter with double-glycine peptidase domain
MAARKISIVRMDENRRILMRTKLTINALPTWIKDGMRALWGRIAFETTLTGLLACAPIAAAKLSQYAIDEVVGERSMGNLRNLICLCTCFVTAVLVLKYAAAWISAITRQRFALSARLRLWAGWIDFVPPDQHQAGDVSNRLLGDVFAIGDVVITYVSSSVVNALTLVVCFVVLFSGNQTLAWIATSFVPGFLIVYLLFGSRIGRTARAVRMSIDRLVCFVVERWKHLDDIRTLRGQTCERRKFEEAANEQYGTGMRALYVQNLASGISEVLIVAWSLFLFASGAFLVMQNDLTLGELIAVQMISGQLVGPLQRLLNLNLSLQVAAVAIGRVAEIEESREDGETGSPESAAPLATMELRDVVCHPAEIGRRDRHVSLFVRVTGRQILSGCNGSGKSSICRIFSGLRDPVAGLFLVNGHRVRKAHSGSLREQTLLLSHEPYFFSGTIRDNLTYGLEVRIGDSEIIDALRTVRLDAWVSAVDGGLDYKIEDEGGNLSLGQRQRLNCARAILHHRVLVILDEAMSGIEQTDRLAIADALARGGCLLMTQTSPSEQLDISPA